MNELFYPVRRTTLHIPNTGPDHDRGRGHLHVILSDPCENGLNLFAVLNSHYDGCDETCVLDDGHDFIRHRSFIKYAKADMVATELLVRSVKEGIITYEGLFDEGGFARIRDGVLASPHTRPRVKKYFRNFCG